MDTKRKSDKSVDEQAASLRETTAGLALVAGDMELVPDLTHMLPRIAQNRLGKELLVRAARVRGAGAEPLAVDATAGLGEDALLLSAAGFRVVMYESDPTIAALLRDALRRAATEPALARVCARMELREEDSVAALRGMGELAQEERPAVVYLDPMFPERRKSAAVKKKFQLLHYLERPCANEDELLAAALAACPRKVVVKRPVKGPYLAGMKPSHSLAGKAVRYDCYVR